MYVTSFLNPVIPVFKDLAAHLFWKAEHMASVHFENGTYHVHAELAEAAQKEESKSPTTTPSNNKSVEMLADHILTDSCMLNPVEFDVPTYFISLSGKISSAYLSRFGPPPEA
jgi:hypothetical protein